MSEQAKKAEATLLNVAIVRPRHVGDLEFLCKTARDAGATAHSKVVLETFPPAVIVRREVS